MPKRTLDEIFNQSVAQPARQIKPHKRTLDEIFSGYQRPMRQQIDKPISRIQERKQSFSSNIAEGAGKGIISTFTGMSGLGERTLRGTLKTMLPKKLEEKFGIEGKMEKTSAERFIPEKLRTPEGVGEKIGFGMEQIAEFLLPSSKIAKLEKGQRLLTRAGIESATLSGITAAQRGKIDEDAKTAAIIGAIFPIAGAGFTAIKKGLKPVGEKIQYTVIRPTYKDIKGGFDIKNVNKYKVGGNLGETTTKVYIKLNQLSKELKTKLGRSTGKVDLNKTYKETVDDLLKKKTQQFGEIKGVERVLNSLKEEIREVSGKNGLVDLIEATNIKRGAGTKGAWAFGRIEPDAGSVEKVYTKFYNKIKTAIEKASPENIKSINKQISELIPISNAALRRLPVEQRNNIISLTDTMGLYASMFDPKALALIGAKRLSRSGKFGQFLVNIAERIPKTSIGKRIFGQ